MVKLLSVMPVFHAVNRSKTVVTLNLSTRNPPQNTVLCLVRLDSDRVAVANEIPL